MRVELLIGIPIHTYGPKSVLGISLYVGVGLKSAVGQAGLEIYPLSLATFIPSVIVFLSMVQLFQKRDLSCEQHNAMHWAELLQVIKTIVSHSPSVCMSCLNLHRVTSLTPAEYVTHCSAGLFTKKHCYLLIISLRIVFHFFLSQTRCSILQSKENNCFAFLSGFAFHVARTFWKSILFFIMFVPHTCLVYFAPLISMYYIPSLVKILHSHISLCT